MFDKKTTFLFSIAGICLGVAGGWFVAQEKYTPQIDNLTLDKQMFLEESKSHGEVVEELEVQRTKASALGSSVADLQREKADAEGEVASKVAEIARLNDELGTLRARIKEGAELQAQLDAANATIKELRAQIESLKAGGAGETNPGSDQPSVEKKRAPITYAGISEMNGMKRTDWKEIGVATAALRDKLPTLYKKLMNGENITQEDQMAIQKHNIKLQRLAMDLQDDIDSHAGNINSEYTHPAVLSNLMASQLDEQGTPLSESQRAQFAAIGDAYTPKWDALQASYTDQSLGLRKLMDEYELKQATMDQFWAVLTSEQSASLVDPEVKGVVGFDLFSPGFLFQTVIDPMKLEEESGLKGRLAELLGGRLGIEEADLNAIDFLLQDYVRIATPRITHPTSRFGVMFPMVVDVVAFGRAQLALMEGIQSTLTLSPESSKRLRDDQSIQTPYLDESSTD